MRGSVIGVLVGALPGAGSDIAAWISYATAKKFSKEPTATEAENTIRGR
jgi:TctA family transporter